MHEATATAPPIDSLRWIRALRSLAKQTACEHEILPRLQALGAARTGRITVAVIGAANAGKSTLLNALIGRKILPVGPLPTEYQISMFPTDGDETFVTQNQPPRPLVDLAQVLSAESPASVDLFLKDDWLADRGVQLVEKIALDTAGAGSTEILDGADVVVLVIDALIPVRRSESLLLRACRDRGLPVVMAVTKSSDMPDDERAASLAHIASHVTSVLPGVRSIEVSRDGQGSALVREELTNAIARTDFEAVRQEQLRRGTRPLLEILRHLTQSKLQTAREAAEAADNASREQQDQRGVENRAWLEIEAELHVRRIQLEEHARSTLRAGENDMVENLSSDLHKTSHVKGWWKDELPYRFEHELRRTAESLSATAEQRVAADMQWLRDEVYRRFQWQVTFRTSEKPALTSHSARTLIDPELSDANRVKVISMIGTSATLLVAGVIFVASTGAAPIAIAGVLGGGVAEIYVRHASAGDRVKARAAIRKIVREAAQAYVTEAASRLLVGYEALLTALKEARLSWHAQNAKNAPAAPAADETDYAGILETIDRLAREVGPIDDVRVAEENR